MRIGSQLAARRSQLLRWLQVQQALEGRGIGDAEIIPGQKSQLATTGDEIIEMRKQSVQSALSHEGHGDVHSAGTSEVLEQPLADRAGIRAENP